MKTVIIHPRAPLCDREQERYLIAQRDKLLNGEWRPKNPSNAALWPKPKQ